MTEVGWQTNSFLSGVIKWTIELKKKIYSDSYIFDSMEDLKTLDKNKFRAKLIRKERKFSEARNEEGAEIRNVNERGSFCFPAGEKGS